MNSLTDWERELALLENKSNLRKLPVIRHLGREVEVNGKVMLNLSSNDYLGLAAYLPLRTEFLQSLTPDTFLPSSSSSRLLTGNFNIYVQIEDLLARLYRKESALVFNSGYHMNTGILPAVSDARTLILADKLVHASIIDGIRLSAAKCIRYRHNRYDQLEQLLVSNHAGYDRIIIVTESIFSMDGDEADLRRLVDSFSFRRERLKKISSLLKDALVKKGYACPSTSHILPMTIGDSGDTVLKADFLQRKGFYALPVRPPTVPEGTSRIRFSLTADITEEEIKSLIELI